MISVIARRLQSSILSRNFYPVSNSSFRFLSSAAEGIPKEIENVEKLEEDLFGREVGQEWVEKPEKRWKHARKQTKSHDKTLNTPKSELKIDKKTNLTVRDLTYRDPIIRDTMMLLRSGKKQKKDDLLLVEGRRLIEEALKANIEMEKLFFSRSEDLEELTDLLKATPNAELYRITYRDLSLWSQLTTSPGLLAIFKRPQNVVSRAKNILPISVICDNIREPNNLGSAIRICAALPCQEVIVMKGCTDPFDTKSLRGGTGAQFQIPIRYPVNWEDLPDILPQENSVLVSESSLKKAHHQPPVDVTQFSLPSQEEDHHFTVVIGGETHGVSGEAYKLMKQYPNSACLHIPLSECIESLNTASALAVVLFELRRKLHVQDKENNSVVDSSDKE